MNYVNYDIESEPLANESNAFSLGSSILDSSLITATLYENIYNVKVINCNTYLQIYIYENLKKRIPKDLKEPKNKKINKSNEYNTQSILKEIELKNIIRSKFNMQRLVKSNIDVFKTFITLTFADNILDVNLAHKEYKKFIYKIKRVFKEFKCITVPEFQKRGAIHYHLLSNISIDNELIYLQENSKKFYHIKFWNVGFNNVENISGNKEKVISYISKYMTKDIDNRLFSHRRYYISGNFIHPKEYCLNLNNKKDIDFYNNLLNNYKINYSSQYHDNYKDEIIQFLELSLN